MSCEERSGFLFAHDCDRLPIGACVQCGKAVCAVHVRPTAEGNVCVTCGLAAAPTPARGTNPARVDSDDPFTYARGSYGSYVPWDDRDRRAFDRPPSVETEGAVEDDAHAT